jgi:signal transduction histidine kinase
MNKKLSRRQPGGISLSTAIMGFYLLGVSSASAHVDGNYLGAEAFYAGFSTVVLAFFLINLALKNTVGVYYSIVFALMLAFIGALEGGVGVIAPAISDRIERSVAMTIALSGASAGFFAAAHAIDPHHVFRAYRSTLYGLSAVTVIFLPAAWGAPQSPATTTSVNSVVVLMLLCHVIPTLSWRTSKDRPQRTPIVIAGFLMLAVVALCWWAFLGPGFGGADRIFVGRFLYGVIAAPTMAAIVISLVDMRRSRDDALKAALSAAKKDAKMSASLLEMERNYSRARDIAAKRTHQISTVSHDIRQPIASMRAELDVLKKDMSPELIERMDRILEHFSELTEELARSAVSDAGEAEASEETEIIPAKLLFAMIERMFQAEASKKGIDLRIADSVGEFHSPALPLMRIASNLVSNAINHSHATKILIGAARRHNAVRLVVADNGHGLTASSDADVFDAGVKGDDSTGSGLGLSIVRDLSDRYGFSVSMRSVERRGTIFSLVIPSESQTSVQD